MVPNRTGRHAVAVSFVGVMMVLAHFDSKIDPIQEENASLIAFSMVSRVSPVRF